MLMYKESSKESALERMESKAYATAIDSADSGTSYVLELRERYLQLVQATLTGVIYEDVPLKANTDGEAKYDSTIREYGWDWPSKAFTMVGSRRLLNFRHLIENAIAHDIPGDIVETGDWRGGACIMAGAVLKTYDQGARRVILCDSFKGLPEPDSVNFPADSESSYHTYSELTVSLDQVKENFRRFNLLDEQVVFIQGWFKDTLKSLPTDAIAVLRLDGDMYESTMEALQGLYDKVSLGGWIIIDDYEVVPECKEAVHHFFNERNIDPVLNIIDGVGRFFQKAY